MTPQESEGIIICNPPYGERMFPKGTDPNEDLKKLYYDLGERLKNGYKGHVAYILTSDPNLRKSISLKTSKRMKVFNGGLECRWLEYDLH